MILPKHKNTIILNTILVTIYFFAVVSGTSFASEIDLTTYPEPPTRKDDPVWKEALTLWKNRGEGKNAENALEIFQSLADNHPTQIESRLWLCRTYYFLGLEEVSERKRQPLLKKSAEHCRSVLQNDPDNFYALYWTTATWYQKTEVGPILPQAKKLAKMLPSLPDMPIPPDGGPRWKDAMENWESRVDPNRAYRAVALWEEMVGKNPGLFEAWAWLTRGYYWLGEIGETKEKQAELYYQGYKYGLKALEINPRHGGTHYWTGANLARYVQRHSFLRKAALAPKIFNHVKVVYQEEPHYYHAGIPHFLAFCLADAGALTRKFTVLFGIPEDIRDPIHISFTIQNNFFDSHLGVAEFAISIGELDLARKHLKYMIDTPADILPAYVAENLHCQKQARAWLEKIGNQ
jgi:tetratricopeptide (TPR) repeat protein